MPTLQLIFLLALSVACLAQNQTEPLWFGGPFRVGTTPLATLPEVSGLVASTQTPGVLWMHNDSGDEPRIFAVLLPGRVAAVVRLLGSTHIDWEDMARGPGPVPGVSYLYLADIGDNSGRRGSIVIYRLRDPLVDTALRDARISIPADSIERFVLRYPDGARDAEALLVDPRSGDIIIVTKRESRCRVYSVSAPHVSGSERILRRDGDLPHQLITAGDVSDDGRRILLKNYHRIWMWQRDTTKPLTSAIVGTGTSVPYQPERQGEAVCFTASGDGYLTTSECEDSGPAAAIMLYLRAESAQAASRLRDVRLPSISVTRLGMSGSMYRIRYTVPDVQRVSLKICNAAMFTTLVVADQSAESGTQERDVDLSKLPAGSYAVVLESASARVSTLLELK